MDKAPEGWSWFDTPSAGPDLNPSLNKDMERAFARCLGGTDGALVMKHLRSVTLDRALSAEAPTPVLRHLEGQRQLYVYIAGLAERGRKEA